MTVLAVFVCVAPRFAFLEGKQEDGLHGFGECAAGARENRGAQHEEDRRRYSKSLLSDRRVLRVCGIGAKGSRNRKRRIGDCTASRGVRSGQGGNTGLEGLMPAHAPPARLATPGMPGVYGRPDEVELAGWRVSARMCQG